MISEAKRMGIWPLPGGVDKYAETLQKCLDFISESSPTASELKKWFIDNFPQVKGGTAIDGYIKTIIEMLSLVEQGTDGKLYPTKDGAEYLRSRDPNFMFRVLDSRIAGISDIIEILSSEPITLAKLHDKLKVRLKKDWDSTNQTFFRVNWLISLGKVKRIGHNYVLVTPAASAITSPVSPVTEAIVEEKEGKIPTSLSELIGLLHRTEKDTANPSVFEDTIAKCFAFLGFESTHIGGSGKADVLLNANLGSSTYKVVIDAKTSTSGDIDAHRIDWDTLEEHKKKYNAKYVAVVGSGFDSSRVQERAAKKGVTLVSTKMLAEVMRLHDATPFDLFSLEVLFKEIGVPSKWRDELDEYISNLDVSSTLLSSIIQQLYSENAKGRELSVEQIEAVLNANGVACTEDQVTSLMTFLSSPPLSIVRRNEKEKFVLCASPATVAKKLQMIRSKIAGTT